MSGELEKLIMRVSVPLMLALGGGGYVQMGDKIGAEQAQSAECSQLISSMVSYHIEREATAVAAAEARCEGE